MFAREHANVWAFVIAAGVFISSPMAIALGGNPRAPRRRNGADPSKRVAKPVSVGAPSPKGGDVPSAADPAVADKLPTIDVLTGLRDGRLTAQAEGLGDGR